MKRVSAFLFLFVLAGLSFVQAQLMDPVRFNAEFKEISDTEAEIVFDGTIDIGWHVYSTNLGEAGPTEAAFKLDSSTNIELVGGIIGKGKEIEAFDNAFQRTLRYYTNKVQFIQKVKLLSKEYHIDGYLEYGACNDESCLPPARVEVEYGKAPKSSNNASAISASSDNNTSAGFQFPTKDITQNSTTNADVADYWKPVIKELNAFGDAGNAVNYSLIAIFALGFVGGLIALLTPCVWPIIPMTVSFFLKRNKDKKKGIRDAVTYGIAIIVIYLTLGLLITLLFGANALNALSTNAIFNILFFLMLIVFAASFFGAFEIRLPSKWTTAVDNKAEQTSGLLSIFLMAFTLALVSFSCTGPIIGFLLVEVSTTGSIVAPAVGMFGFALALALPFTIFALFPSLLKSAPKSGNWMNVIKVSLAFIELAFALKFLSVADLAYQWGILDREVFIALWVVIFALFGMYLLGKIKFPHDDDSTKVGVTRFFMALFPLSFALYMVPGLWGAPLKAISAFAPPLYTQDFSLFNGDVHAQFDDYEKGMAYAKEHGKPVMLDFTGYGCVNCRNMELYVWTNPTVKDIIDNDYVLITLYVDKKEEIKPITVEENGKTRKLRTVGDKWSYLQQVKFGANSQPYYVLLDNEGLPLNKSYAYDKDIPSYIKFLETGLSNYKKSKSIADNK